MGWVVGWRHCMDGVLGWGLGGSIIVLDGLACVDEIFCIIGVFGGFGERDDRRIGSLSVTYHKDATTYHNQAETYKRWQRR